MRRFFLAAFIAVLPAFPASADSLTYHNDRFGTAASFPADLFGTIAAPPENGDGMTFLSEDGAQLAVFGRYNANDLTPKTLLGWLTGIGADNDAAVEYKATGSNWVVVSGHDGDMIYYERHEFGADGVIHALSLRYPDELRDIYDPLVGPIARSLDGP